VIAGLQDFVDVENELAMQTTLREVCTEVMRRSQHGLSQSRGVQAQLLSTANSDPDCTSSSIRCIEILWDEEYEVSSAITKTIDNGALLE